MHEEDNEKKKAKERSCLKRLNIWMRITDFILDKISHDEILEILELKIGKGSPDLLQKSLNDKVRELGLLKHFRFIFTKILVAKLMLALYVYNKALNYFFEMHLQMPASMVTAPISLSSCRSGKPIQECTSRLWSWLGIRPS